MAGTPRHPGWAASQVRHTVPVSVGRVITPTSKRPARPTVPCSCTLIQAEALCVSSLGAKRPQREEEAPPHELPASPSSGPALDETAWPRQPVLRGRLTAGRRAES